MPYFGKPICIRRPIISSTPSSTAENACLIPLLKNEAFTGKDFEATWDLIRRYRIQNDVYVENGRAVPVPLPIVVARAKLTRVILRCKDLFDTQTYSEADWAVEEAEGTLVSHL